MSTQKMIGLYGNAIQDSWLYPWKDMPPIDQQISMIKASRVNVMTIWAWHVLESGDIYYNDTLAVQNGELMLNTDGSHPKWLDKDIVARVKSFKTGTTNIEKIYFSLGGDSEQPGQPKTNSSFYNIKNLFASETGKQLFLGNLQVLINEFGIDGFDFDYEAQLAPFYSQTIVDLTNWICSKDLEITYCDFNEYYDEWMDCLGQVYAHNGYQPVKAFNFMNYQPYEYEFPIDWIEKGGWGQTGVEDPAAFMRPGYACMDPAHSMGVCPDKMSGIISQYLKPNGFNGAWLWNSDVVFSNEDKTQCDPTPTLDAYADAIEEGLG